MRWSLSCMLIVALGLEGCGGDREVEKAADKGAECEAFLKTARAEQREAKAPAKASSEKTTGQQRADRYRAYAANLEKIAIRDAELKKLVDEYITHVRGSAALFDELEGKDVFQVLEKVDERDEAGNALTRRINAYCGATNPKP